MIADIHEQYEGAVVFDGLEDALIGYGSSHGNLPVAVYSERKILIALQEQGMNEEDSVDFYCYNIQCLHAGPQTPVILSHVIGEC